MISRIFHRIWIGPAPLPAEHRRWIDECERLHPNWHHYLWDGATLLPDSTHVKSLQAMIPLNLRSVWNRANAVQKSDIGGYLLVERFGGVYCDTDYKWYQPIDPYLHGCEAFCSLTDRGQISASIFGGRPRHPAWRAVLEALPAHFRPSVQLSTSSKLLTRVLAHRADIRRLERRVFIPVPYAERHRLKTETAFPGSAAVHQFAASWVK